ncbi:MAG: hypothetical protein AAB535_01160 [Patescibacteria group bacterium]
MKNCLGNFFLLVLIGLILSCILLTTLNVGETVATKIIALADGNVLPAGLFLASLPIMALGMGVMVRMKTKSTWPIVVLELAWVYIIGYPTEKATDTMVMYGMSSFIYLITTGVSGARMHLLNQAITNFHHGKLNFGSLLIGFFEGLNKAGVVAAIGFSLLYIGTPEILIACLIGAIIGGEALKNIPR